MNCRNYMVLCHPPQKPLTRPSLYVGILCSHEADVRITVYDSTMLLDSCGARNWILQTGKEMWDYKVDLEFYRTDTEIKLYCCVFTDLFEPDNRNQRYHLLLVFFPEIVTVYVCFWVYVCSLCACMCVPEYMYVHCVRACWSLWPSEKGIESLEPESQAVVSHHVSAGNWN